MCVCLELFAVAGRRVLDSCTRVSAAVSVVKMSCVQLCYHFLYLYDNRGRKGCVVLAPFTARGVCSFLNFSTSPAVNTPAPATSYFLAPPTRPKLSSLTSVRPQPRYSHFSNADRDHRFTTKQSSTNSYKLALTMSDSSSDAPRGTDNDGDFRFLDYPLTTDSSDADTLEMIENYFEGRAAPRHERFTSAVLQPAPRRNALVPQMSEGVGNSLQSAGMPLPRTEPPQPVVTLASTLPTTTYDEKNEAEGTTRTLAYVRVQRALLEYLNTKPSDSLNARQARRWTQAIDPAGNKKPKAEDALRLCYYMRSQGYDTFARVANKTLSLYVVKQGARTHEHVLYWQQDVVTNEVLNAPAPQPTRTRRNAIPDSPSFFAAAVPTEDQMGRIIEAETAMLEALDAELSRAEPDPEYISPLSLILQEFSFN
jgi:hypothetical protein